MEMKVSADLVKKMREERHWSQDHLADVSGLNIRTIQRIEKTGNISLDSKKALAAVFEVGPDDLNGEARKEVSSNSEEKFLVRITDGAELINIVFGAYAFRLNHDTPKSEEEADLLAGIARNIQDWGDCWQEVDSGERVRLSYEFQRMIEEVESLGYWVFGIQANEKAGYLKDEKWPVATIFFMRSSNPRIIKLDI